MWHKPDLAFTEPALGETASARAGKKGKIVVGVVGQPPPLNRSTAPPLAPITLVPPRDTTAYIIERYVVPILNKSDGKLAHKRIEYSVGWTDLPAARMQLDASRVLDYVSPAALEEFEYKLSLQRDEEEHQKARQEAEEAKRGNGRLRPGRQQKQIEVDESRAKVAAEAVKKRRGRPKEGPSLSTPTKLRLEEFTELETEKEEADTSDGEAIYRQLHGASEGSDIEMTELEGDGETFGNFGTENGSEASGTESTLGGMTSALGTQMKRFGLNSGKLVAPQQYPLAIPAIYGTARQPSPLSMAQSAADLPTPSPIASGIPYRGSSAPPALKPVPDPTRVLASAFELAPASSSTKGKAGGKGKKKSLAHGQDLSPSPSRSLPISTRTRSSASPPPKARQSIIKKSTASGSSNTTAARLTANKKKRPRSQSGGKVSAKDQLKQKTRKKQKQEDSWAVERVEGLKIYRVDGRRIRYFLVRWEGNWPPDQKTTWEPEENLSQDMIDEYLEERAALGIQDIIENSSARPPRSMGFWPRKKYSSVSEAFEDVEVDRRSTSRDRRTRQSSSDQEEGEVLKVTEDTDSMPQTPSEDVVRSVLDRELARAYAH